jgi:catechol 2,3-dioxygenase-like lactoylglutathione lyase family enzyme
MTDDATRPARRVLHVCYCCDDLVSATAFFVDNFGMRNFMGTPAEKSDGAILGLDRQVVSPTQFVYDARGPRTSPAIEVQEWVDPPLTGTPVDDPTRAGIQALGIAVPDLAATSERLAGAGCIVRGAGTSPFDGAAWTTVRDPTGVTLDVVEDRSLPTGESRLHHLRVTSTDLDASRGWYEGLGFETLGRTTVADASFLDSSIGAGTTTSAEVLRLRLPDEPFEALLVEWRSPAAHGRHVSEPNHAGLYRAALGVDDTRASYAAMSAAGWAFDRAPTSVVLRGTPVPDLWICFLGDPDGVPFELVERPRTAFR